MAKVQTQPKASKGSQKPQMFRNRYLIMLDVLAIVASYFGILFLAKDFNILSAVELLFVERNMVAIVVTMTVYLLTLYLFDVYSTMWVYAGTRDYIRLLRTNTIGALITIALCTFITTTYSQVEVHPKIYIASSIFASFLIVFTRMAVRGMNNLFRGQHKETGVNAKRLMIVGAGVSAAIVLKDIYSNENLNYNVVCFVDDDKTKQKATIGGVKVRGNRFDIPRLAKEYDIDEILVAMPSASPTERKNVIEICNETSCKIKVLSSVDQMISDKDMTKAMRNVEIEDLLAREPIVLNNTEIEEYIKDQVVLVTGGGGSIGSELCRQIMRFKPKKLVVVDIYENNAYDLQMELNYNYPENKPEVIIASVRDMDRIDDVFNKYRPYIVFHAAAHKHVPLMEVSPGEAIKNNVIGTYNVTKCADKYRVKRFVMISTDKAVNPTNVMGATKRICEMIVQSAQQTSKTEFVAVRFGNVLGSNGSVIPLFKRQIEHGGPVTLTDKRITRFFMTIPEAAQLVLQAASYAHGGEIFVLDMGEPVKIYDLARNLIRLAGYKPDEEIKIEVVGLRPGEKLYEELLMDEEGLTNTSHNKIFIGKPLDVDRDELENMIKNLESVVETGNAELIKDEVAKVVPTYVRNK